MGVEVADALVQPSPEGQVKVLVTNNNGFTQKLDTGTVLGMGVKVEIVPLDTCGKESAKECSGVYAVAMSHDDVKQKERLRQLIEKPATLGSNQTEDLFGLLENHHRAFALDPGERGETDAVQLEIDTGEATPRRQSIRCLPFAVRQEVARQLEEMQKSGVIGPSNSPWASPVVMVRKKDGSHRFCIDYWQLNSVTKPDQFPLPRIEDLLDQAGKSSYFSTFDLGSGFWQVCVHPDLMEKTASITPQDLYEFRVMPFGLTNAPSVFQRLMQKVLAGLNPVSGPDFVSVYIDDMLVFLTTLEEHLQHLEKVISCLSDAGLKLQPAKCHFVCEEANYLGHVITPFGLRTNEGLVVAVKNFPIPVNPLMDGSAFWHLKPRPLHGSP